ncbi:MAG: 16S rRNA (guanine(966)-N(2))-methyltransferase RsmD [Candidatus Delongbacteria bacterium]|nr:16S rRNA (guanine(966)-N(2))-methyltransferase RsmD [Candidatus Delongbacteria bacterium]
MIKITGGNLRSRVLQTVSGEQLRPTTSFFREWIFNVLNYFYNLNNVILLDLFSGTGIISFEFISRNAKKAVMIENNLKFLKIAEKNISKLNIENITILKADALRYVINLVRSKADLQFNVIFMDPPYEDDTMLKTLLELIFSNLDLFPKDLLVITESSKDFEPVINDQIELYRSKTGGRTKMMVFRRVA